jgi:antitoxin ParD1/3/4
MLPRILANFANQRYIEFRRSLMPTRNVNLTPELDRLVTKRIKSGRYENASEVVRAALRSLERDEREYEIKLKALRAAIKKGRESGIAEPGSFDRVRAKFGLPSIGD